MKRFSAILLSVMLVLSLAVPALAADSSISYTGHNLFTFEPGSAFTETDLFDNFKGVMPGDVLTETITIRNSAYCCDYIKVYMHAVPHHETDNPLSENVAKTGETVATMEKFLEQLGMKVWDGDRLIYSASPDELDGLKDRVYLETLRRGKTAQLKVELTVPITLGNEFANRVGEVDWVFTVEEYNDPRPKTGDDTKILPYVLILTAGVGGMFFLLVTKRRKKETD